MKNASFVDPEAERADENERALVKKILEEVGDDIAEAARILKTHPERLREFLRANGLDAN